MITQYISSILQFNCIAIHKYENCITRKQKEDELKEKPNYFQNIEQDLFAGDEIVGYYDDGKITSICLYTWKENNNPKEIKAYSMLKKWKVKETINDVQILEKDY